MSHFTVLVIGSNPESQLDPFDENIEMPRYIKKTREQAIAESRSEFIQYEKNTYAEYIKDKEAYRKTTNNKAHLDFLENEFPKRLKWNDEEHFQNTAVWYDDDYKDEDGNLYSTCNPKSKWDWYQLGGRWSGMIKIKDGTKSGIKGESGVFGNEIGIDQAVKGDINNLDELKTFAVIKDGEWYEKGSMGWWGISTNDKAQEMWDEEIVKLLSDVPDYELISIYDCHI